MCADRSAAWTSFAWVSVRSVYSGLRLQPPSMPTANNSAARREVSIAGRCMRFASGLLSEQLLNTVGRAVCDVRSQLAVEQELLCLQGHHQHVGGPELPVLRLECLAAEGLRAAVEILQRSHY